MTRYESCTRKEVTLSLFLSLSFIIDRVYIFDSVAFFNLFLEKYRASDIAHIFSNASLIFSLTLALASVLDCNSGI